MSNDTLLSLLPLTLDGQTPPNGLLNSIEQIVVETSLHLPSVATLMLHDPALNWLDSALLLPGKELVVKSQDGKTLFDGEIVELEAEFSDRGQYVIVRAFDRLHRLARGTINRAFVQVSDSDIAQTCAGEVGLSVDAETTSGQHSHYIQANESNLELLQRRAAANGYLLFVEGKKLHFTSPKEAVAVALAWGATLAEFRPRLSSIGQLDQVSVRGWDMKTQQAIVGQATKSKLPPQVGLQAKNFFASVKPSASHADLALSSQDQAKRMAQGLLDGHASRFIEAEGVALGTPKLKAGVSLKITGVGERFSGDYFVTSATHRIVPGQSYLTEFSVSGLNPSSLLGMLAPPEPQQQALGGLTIGIVSDNNDPDKLGRVKVKYPLLYDDNLGADITSDWIRINTMGAGAGYGMLFLPEVNDEVIVAFAHGDQNAPFVLGTLWSNKHMPPLAPAKLLQGGKVVQRALYSRSGHYILLDDSDADGGISLVDKKGNKLVFKAQDDSLLVETKGKITMTTKSDFVLQVQGNASLTANGNLSLEAKGNLSFKATGNLKAEAMGQAELNGTSGAKLASSAIVDVQGAMINLN
jgi:phage protein D